MEYKNISNLRCRHKERRNTEGNVKESKYNKYNQFVMSEMKGITKDHKSITKDYDSLFLRYERSMLKIFRITFRAIHPNSPVLAVSLLHLRYNSGF